MSEISGLPSALGIEAIDIEPTVGGGMTVRVAGHWPHGRPAWDGPAMLVLGTGEGRRRIDGATDPSDELSAAWRVSFAVPDELVPGLDGPLWLGLGTIMVPLSISTLPVEPPAPGIDPELLLNRELRTLEATARVARRAQAAAEARADALEAEVERLRHELSEARREPERLAALAAERDRLRRQAEQREYAEAARRSELEGELSALEGEMDALRVRLRDRVARIHELERELRHARRSADEARQAASVEARVGGSPRTPVPRRRQARVLSAEFALPRPVLPAARPAPPRALPALPGALAAERTLVGHMRASARSAPVRTSGPDSELRIAELDRALAEVTEALARERAWASELSATLARERASTAELEAALERERTASGERIAGLEADVARQRGNAMRALETIAAFRRELKSLPVREADGAPPIAAPAEAATPEPEAPAPSEPVQADRLAAALSRLRERVPEPSVAVPDETPKPAAVAVDPESDAGTIPTDALSRVFQALAAEDPAMAGRLVLTALPLQHLAHGRPVAYDLILDAGTCLHVTAGPNGTSVAPADAPRAYEATQFTVTGSPASLARLLAAGPVRRRLGRGLGRVRGERRSLAPLDALVRAPLPLRAFLADGVHLDPSLTLRLVAVAIDPALTRAERFTLAHRPSPDAPPSATLHVSDGRPPSVTDLPLEGQATCTLVCPSEVVLAALLDPGSVRAQVLGDERPLRLLHDWLARA